MRPIVRIATQITVVAVILTVTGCASPAPRAGTSTGNGPSSGVVRTASAPATGTSRNDPIMLRVASPQPTPAPTLSTAQTVSPSLPSALTLVTPSQDACRSGPADGLPAAVVHGTNGQGLWVRDEPAGSPLTLLSEGARAAVAGKVCLADGRWWARVETATGLAGWAAVDYLAPASDAPTTAPAQPGTASSEAGSAIRSQAAPTPSSAAPTPSSAAPTPSSAAPTPTPAAPTTVPTAVPPAATPAPTRPPVTPVPFPPLSQLDPRLRTAYQALVMLPKIGPAFAEIVKKSDVHLAVGDLQGAWGLFRRDTNVITVDPATLENDPRAVAVVLAHELTHVTQVPRDMFNCTIPSELEAHKVGVNVWEAFWSGDVPPTRTKLEQQLGDWLVWFREGGDPGVVEHLLKDSGYKDNCPSGG